MNMKTIKTIQIILLIFTTGFWISPSFAKGPTDKIMIDGPDLNQPIVIDDKELISLLDGIVPGDSNESENPPSEIHSIYVITRSYADGDNVNPFDQLLFIPNLAGERGWIYYVGIVNGYGPYDGNWYQTTENIDDALLRILKDHGVDFDLHTQGAGTLNMTNQESPSQTLLIVSAVMAAFGIGFLSSFLYQSRRGKLRTS
jgi:hypothetical protein